MALSRKPRKLADGSTLVWDAEYFYKGTVERLSFQAPNYREANRLYQMNYGAAMDRAMKKHVEKGVSGDGGGRRKTIERVFGKYLKSLKRPQLEKANVEFWTAHLTPGKLINDVTAEDITNGVDKLMDQTTTRRADILSKKEERHLSVATILNYLGFVQRAFNYAADFMDAEYSRKINWRRQKRRVKDARSWRKVKRKPFTDDELRQIRAAIDPDFVPLIDYTLFAGHRKMNAVNLHESEINREKGTIEVIGKGDKEIETPLHGDLDALLRRLQEANPGSAIFTFRPRRYRKFVRKDGVVVEYRTNQRYPLTEAVLRSAWDAARKKARIAKTWHDLRRTFASRLARFVTPTQLAEALAHADSGELAETVYATTDQGALRAGMAQMSADLKAALNPAPDLRVVAGSDSRNQVA